MITQIRKALIGAIALPLSLVLLAGCGGEPVNDNNQTQQETPSADPASDTPKSSQSNGATAEVMESIPSPLELSTLLKEMDATYDVSMLNDHTIVNEYGTSFKKALNLGVYSTDLGFANIFQENQDALNFLNATRKLADGINIGQFFEYNELKTLVEDSDNLEKLVEKTNVNLEKINQSLRDQNRESLSILMLAGGWTEVVYLTTQVYEDKKDEKLKEAIADQKITLDRILLVLEVYEKDEIKQLYDKMKELRDLYDNVKVEVEVKPPKMVEENGSLRSIDQNVTHYTVTDKDISAITQKVSEIRQFITAV